MPTSKRQYSISADRFIFASHSGGQTVDRLVANLVDNIKAKPGKSKQ